MLKGAMRKGGVTGGELLETLYMCDIASVCVTI